MPLTLTIENMDTLPDGGPLSVTVRGQRGIDIGREAHLDWTLPDPSRFISGKHCEVRWREGGFWLHDVSTNGTFLNGADHRMTEPHRLRSGDRLTIGHYIVAVMVDGEEAESRPSRVVKHSVSEADMWNAGEAAPPPIDKRELRVQPPRPVGSDFLDWAVDVPDPTPGSPSGQSRGPMRAPPAWEKGESADMAWAPPPPPPPPPEPPPPVPQPRRPGWSDAERATPPEPQVDWGASAPPTPRVAPPPPRPEQAWLEPSAPEPPTPVVPKNWSEPQPTPPPSAPVSPASLPPERPFGSAPPARLIEHGVELPPDPPIGLPQAGAFPPPPQHAAPSQAGDVVRRFARAAGVPEQHLASTSPDQLAEQLGKIMRAVTEDVMQLLSARSEARRVARSANQTTIQALDNNPLKFSPSADEALRIMFGPPTRSYLDANRAFSASFADLKRHQLVTFRAMQRALQMLIEDMAPEAIENGLESDRGLSSLLGASRKQRAWETYTTRWNAKALRQDDGMLGAFMLYFAQAYDEADRELGS